MTEHQLAAPLGQVSPFMLDNIPVRGMVLRLENLQHYMPSFKEGVVVYDMLVDMLLASAALMSDLKHKANITLQIQSESALPLLVAQCGSTGGMRAYAKPQDNIDVEAITYAQVAQKAIFSVHVEQGEHTYQSLVSLDEVSVASSVEHYFNTSVQVPTYFRTFHDKSQQTGAAFFLQQMPNEDLPEDDWRRMLFLLETVKTQEALPTGISIQQLLTRIFAEDTVRVFNPNALSFVTPLLRDRMIEALRSIGVQQVKHLLEKGPIEMTCSFSGQTITFTEADMVDIFGTQWQEE